MNLPEPIARQVTQLFKRMDEAYGLAAATAGFECKGCRDNCCLTRFYHHTLLELLYLKSGLAALPAAQQGRLQKRAHETLRQMAEQDRGNESVRVMCPLNAAQRCTLYAHRPMICRLHGIPHVLRRPDGKRQSGPGCDNYYAQSGRNKGAALERTPLYVQMAEIERELRRMSGFNGKIKMTVAEMIIDDSIM